MQSQEALSSLFIHPELSVRSAFKKVSQELNMFENVVCESRLAEGIERLRGSRPFEFVYISTRFDKHIAGEFVKFAKISPQGVTAAMLAVLTKEREAYPLLPSIEGVDGELIETCSRQQLQATVEKVSPIIQERKQIVLLSSLQKMAKTLPQLVDLRAEAFLENKNAPTATKLLNDAKARVSALQPAEKLAYFHALISAFEAVPAPTRQSDNRGGMQFGGNPNGRVVVRR